MINKKENIVIVNDGDFLTNLIEETFANSLSPKDIHENKDGKFINFVGFIYERENILISFPKNSFDKDEKIRLSNKLHGFKYYILLYKCILKAMKSFTNTDKRFLDLKQDFDSMYPFNSFLSIYDYYKKYGLFTNEREKEVYGYNGKISWKSTISKSPKVINNNNLLFLPMTIKTKENHLVFISKCMAYAIDSTLEKFNLFLNGEKVGLRTNDINFNDLNIIIQKLNESKKQYFKNIHSTLINNLIDFFSHQKLTAGPLKLVTHNFDLIWEAIVREYLNTRFLEVKNNTEFIFSEEPSQSNNFTNKPFYPDDRGKDGHFIRPDFYLEKDYIKYIFDAKYFKEISKLDYKQISYYFLLKNYKNVAVKTYNALVIPCIEASHSNIHFKMSKDFSEEEQDFLIIEHYLNTINAMESYTNTK